MLPSTRPAWSKQGYVCRACRHRHRHHLQIAHQRRWNSQHQTESSTSPQAADSWFDSINDISDQYSSHKPTSPKPARKSDDGEGERRRRRRRESRGTRGRLEASKTSQFRPERSQARDLKSLADSLATSVDGAITPHQDDKKKDDDEFKTAFLTAHSRHRDRRKRAEGTAKPHVIVSDLLSELKAGAEARRVRQDEGIDLHEEPEEELEDVKVAPEDTEPRPFPTFRGRQSRPVDTVDVPAGRTVADVAGDDPAKPKVWKAKTSPADSGLGSKVESRVLSNQPMNLMERFKETQARKPWGGAKEERASSPPPKATFNTLTKADRITPKKPIETSVAKKPFGIIDSFKQLWRGAPKDPMEGLRSRLLTTNDAEDTSTTGFSFGMTTPKLPSMSEESRVPDTRSADSQPAGETGISTTQSLEQTVAPTQKADEAAVDSLTKLHADRSQRSGGSDVAVSPAENESLEGQEAVPETQAVEEHGPDQSIATPRIEDLSLESAMRKLRNLEAQRRRPMTKANHNTRIRGIERLRARVRALGGDPKAQLNTSDVIGGVRYVENKSPENKSPELATISELRERIERWDSRLVFTRNATLRKTIRSRMQLARSRIRALEETAQEASPSQAVQTTDATTASPTTSSPVEETEAAAVSEPTSLDEGSHPPTQQSVDLAQSLPDDSASRESSGMSLADAMKQDARPKAPRRQTRTRRVNQNKAPVEALAEIQHAPEEATSAVEPEAVTETEAVDEGEAEEQARVDVLSVQLADLEVKPLDLPQPPVPYLEYGLDRVLFNPGIYQLQDAASRVYNFDPYLQKIMPVEQFDFNSLKEYKTSFQDTALAEIAKQQEMRYIGSTSSMTSSLAHFHYLISNWRPLNLDMLSQGYHGPGTSHQFTSINKAPSAIFLRWKNGSYAIDADKEYDSPNVLMLLGKSMELLLTLPKDEYEKYRKSDPRSVSEEQRTSPESYQYSTMGDFLMRSQLDAYDPRLPGNGTFDLKTRAVVSIRVSSRDHEKMTGYEIYSDHGRWCSYEKEYHDMARATMLKYMLQARMGRMNGIFVAYHNVKRIFGFQYIPISEMDRLLHGQTDPSLGDQEFKASLKIMNDLLNKATAKYPEQSLRIHFEAQKSTGEDSPPYLHMFAEPMTEDQIEEIQNKNKEKIAEYERNIMGKEDAASSSSSTTTTITADAPATATETVTHPAADDATAYARQKLVHSSDSPADKPFLEKVETLQAGPLRPLFYATVLVQSSVNGAVPKDDRPKNLKAEDSWELNYLIKDYDISSHEWALYEDMKARRKEALCFVEDGETELDGEGNVMEKEENLFLTFLEKLSKQGGKVREKMDAADRESGKDRPENVVRVDDLKGLPRVREKVESVEDYLGWMYKKE